MYIKKEFSNGRGELELAGELDGVRAIDMLGRDLYLDCGPPYGVRPLDVFVGDKQGKKRLRIRGSAEGRIHLHRQLLALLMLPESTRDEKTLRGGQPTVMYRRFAVSRLKIRSLALDPGRATIALESIDLVNGSDVDEVDFARRMATIVRIHDGAGSLPKPIENLVAAHRAILASPTPIRADAEVVVAELMKAIADDAPDYGLEYASGTDVLTTLEALIAPKPAYEVELPSPISQIPDDELVLRRRVVGQWRKLVSARGYETVVFRRKVMNAYHERCVVCGFRYPRSKHCRIPGVDAAHILPWADFDLDVVSNGLCLCKTHHWAFDQGLIALIVDDSGTFVISVTPMAERALASDPETLAELRRFEGAVPNERLPFLTTERPNPQFLAQLYDAVKPDHVDD